ncbi:MAG: DNRLRE domain-containing protein, partial [Coriobacteriia bacterium]|nr:DNRLRE domain-containing protein [Coriobacteriia bacterium]
MLVGPDRSIEEGYWPAPEGFEFAEDSISEFVDQELIYLTETSNIFFNSETREETEEFFSLPVRFEDGDGELVEIDPSLVASNIEGIAYETSAGPTSNFFPEVISGANPFVLTNDNREINFSILKDEEVVLRELEEIEFIDPFGEAEDRPLAAIYDIGDELSFRVHSTDIGIKSEFILESMPESNVFTYELSLTGLRAELSEETTAVLLFCSEDATTTPIAVIPEGIMWDASEDGAYSHDIAYDLVRISEGKYHLSLVVSEAYLKCETRVFPITVDPTVQWQGTAASNAQWFSTNWVRNGADAASVVGNTNSMPFGTGASTGRVHRSFVQAGANFTNNIRGMSVTAARIDLTHRTQTSGLVVQVHRVTGNLPSGGVGTLTWNNAPATASIRNITTAGARSVHGVDVTAWARGVANNTMPNQGFMIRANNESQYGEFYGANDANAGRRPRLVVTRVAPPTAPTAVFIGTQFWRPGQANPTLTWGVINAAAGFNRAEYRIVQGTVSGGVHVGTATAHTGWIHFNPGQTIPIPAAANGCVQVQVRGIDNTGVAGPHGFAWLHIARNAPSFTLGDITNPPNNAANFAGSRNPAINLTNMRNDIACNATTLRIEAAVVRPDGITGPFRAVYTRAGNAVTSSNSLPATFVNDFIPGHSRPHTIRVRTIDQAGNTSAVAERPFFYDSSILELRQAGIVDLPESQWFTHTDLPELYWADLVHTTGHNIPRVDLPYDTRLRVSRTRDPQTNRLINPIYITDFDRAASGTVPLPPELFPDGVPDGRHPLHIEVVNVNGRISPQTRTINYQVDTTPPKIKVSIVDHIADSHLPIVCSDNNNHFSKAEVVGGNLQLNFQIARDYDSKEGDTGEGVTSGFVEGRYRIEGVTLGTSRPIEFPFGGSETAIHDFDTKHPITGLNDGTYRLTFTGRDLAGNIAEPAIVYFEVQNAFMRPTIQQGIDGGFVNNTGEFPLSWSFPRPPWREGITPGIQWVVVGERYNTSDLESLNRLDWTDVYSTSAASSSQGSFTAATPRDENDNPVEGRYLLLTRALPACANASPGHFRTTQLRVTLTPPEVAITSFDSGIVSGTIRGEQFDNYELLIKQSGQSDAGFEQVGAGKRQAYDSVLGFVDLARDFAPGRSYTLRLRAWDIAGNENHHDFEVFNAVSADSLANEGGLSLVLPDANTVTSNEDQFVVETDQARDFSSFEWFVNGASRNSSDTAIIPPAFSNYFACADFYPEASYHTILGKVSRSDGAGKTTPTGSALVPLAGDADVLVSGGEFHVPSSTFFPHPDAHTAQLILAPTSTALPFTALRLKGLDANVSGSLSVGDSDFVALQRAGAEQIWQIEADADTVYATDFRLKLEVESPQAVSEIVLSDLDLSLDFISPDVFHIDFLSAATPADFSARNRLDYRTHFYWSGSEQAPADLSYEIYYLQAPDLETAENIPLSRWSKVATGIRENVFATPNLNFSENYFYRLVPVRTTEIEDQVLTRVTGTPSRVVASRVADENELFKRLGIQDYWAYENIDTPLGSAMVEKSRGNLVFQQTDRALEFDPMLQDGITRTHNAQSSLVFSFGQGTSFTYGVELLRQQNTRQYTSGDFAASRYNYFFKDATGTLRTFVQDGENSFFTRDSKRIRLTSFAEPVQIEVCTNFGRGDTAHSFEDLLVGYVITSHKKREYWFNQGGQLIYITDTPGQLRADIPEGRTHRAANHEVAYLTFVYSAQTGLLESATSRGMRTIHFAHNADRLISHVWLPDRLTDNGQDILGSVISYRYEDKRLVEVRQHVNHLTQTDFLGGIRPAVNDAEDIYHSYAWQAISYWDRPQTIAGSIWRGLTGIFTQSSADESYFISELSGVPVLIDGDYQRPVSTFDFDPNSNPVQAISATNPIGDRVDINQVVRFSSSNTPYTVATALRTPAGVSDPTSATRTTLNHLGHPELIEVGTTQDISEGQAHTTRQSWSNHLLDMTATAVEYHDLLPCGTVVTNTGENITRTSYNNNRLPVVTTECSGVRVIREYDGVGINSEEVSEELVIDADGSVDYWASWDYCDDGFEIRSVEISHETTTTRSYFADGNLHTETTSLQRFEDGSPVGAPVRQVHTVMAYDVWGNHIAETRTEYGSPNTVHETLRSFDWQGRTLSERTGVRVGEALREQRTTTNTYDSFGRLTASRTVEPCGTVVESSSDFDRRGNLTRQVDERGVVTTNSFDLGGRTTATVISAPTLEGNVIPDQISTTALDVATVEVFTPEGTQVYENARRTMSTDAAGLVTRAYTDALGRTIRLNKSGVNTDTTFTACGKTLATITSPEGSKRSEARVVASLFDRAGNQTHTIDTPEFDRGNFMLSDTSIVTSSVFDAFGRAVSTTDGEGHTTTFTFDARGQMASASMPAAEHFTSDRQSEILQASVFFSNEEIADGGTVNTTRNAQGNYSQTRQDASGRVLSITDFGRSSITTVTAGDPAPVATTFSHNEQGQLTRTTFANGDHRLYSYDLAGNLIRTEWRRASGTLEMTSTSTFDSRGQVTTITDYSGEVAPANVVYHQAFAYDILGRRVSSFEGHTRPDAITPEMKTRYYFDAGSRLASLDYPALSMGVQQAVAASNVVTQLSASAANTFAIKSDGTLWGWGDNESGQLGVGNRIQSGTPTEVSSGHVSGEAWKYISSGSGFAIAIRDDGTLWSWGSNWSGMLGHGDTLGRLSPVQVALPQGSSGEWTKVSAGDLHSMALKSDGSIWTWGSGNDGRLGTGDNTRRFVPTRITDSHVSGNMWTDISAGHFFSAALRDDGSLWMWGQGFNGLLGQGSTASSNIPVRVSTTGVSGNRWVGVSAGTQFTLGIRDDGTLWSWGINGFGQLGNGSTLQRLVPTQVQSAHVSGSKWTHMSAAGRHAIAVRDDGSLWTWGSSLSGQLGQGDTLQRNTPVRITDDAMKGVSTILPTGGNNAFHSVLARGDGSVWVWGDDNYGQLGLGYTPPELEEPEICCCDGGLCCCDILPPWNVVTSPQLLLEGGAAQTEVAELSAAGQRYQFDGFGRLSAIVARIEVDGVEGEVPLRTYSYDPWGRVAEIRDFNLSRPEAAPVVKSTTYDSFGRVSRVEYGFEAQATPVRPTSIEIISGQVGSTDLEVFESFEYRFDKNHNIVRKRHIVNGELIDGPSHNEVRNYSFDAVGRLVSSESSVKGTNLYGWDKAGNRRFVSTDGIVEWSDFNGLNQLTSKYNAKAGITTQYFYDANGNQIREEAPGQIRTFAYNVCNRLAEVRAGTTADNLTTINANTFRGDGQRISKLENGRHVNYVYQSGSVLYTTDANHELINLHLKAPDGALIAMVHADADDSTFSSITTDIRRSTSTVLDAQGKFTTGFRYTDFGETTKLAETDELIEVAYTGGIWDQS